MTWPVKVQPLNRVPRKGGTHLAHLTTGTAAGSTAGREPSKANVLRKALLRVSHRESNDKDVS